MDTKSSNQSLERTPLGWQVCMGRSSMVSLSSSRWAISAMTRISIVIWLLISSYCLAGSANNSWPKKLNDFSLKDGSMIISGFKITAKISSDQDGSWRSGPVYDIKVKNLKTDESRDLTYTSIEMAILDFYHGWPQLEIWDRCGEDVYSRSLTRFEKSDYDIIRTDTFTSYQSSAKNTSITAFMPHCDDTLYFIETRFPEVYPRQEAQQGAAANASRR